MELLSALDADLESRVQQNLDSLYLNVAPGREHVNNLGQLGHANLTVAVQFDLLVVVGV